MKRTLTILAFVLLIGTAAGQSRQFKVTRIDLRTGDTIVAQTIWISNASEQLDLATNWSNGTPDSTHTPAVFNGRGQASVQVNMSALSGSPFQILVEPTYSGDIGGPGNSLGWNAGVFVSTFRGSGDMWIANSAIQAQQHFVVDSRNNENAVTFDNTIVDISVKSGYVTILPTCTIAAYTVVAGVDATLEIQKADAAEENADHLFIESGVCLNNRVMGGSGTSVSVSGGLLRQTANLSNSTIVNVSGGRLEYTLQVDTLTVPILFVTGTGIFDVSKMSVTWGAAEITVGPQATFLGDVGNTVTPSVFLEKEYP